MGDSDVTSLTDDTFFSIVSHFTRCMSAFSASQPLAFGINVLKQIK